MSTRLKLSVDEAEQLEEVMSLDGFKVLVEHIIPALIEAKQARLLSHPLTKTEDFTELAMLRKEVDGAWKLAADLKELKKHLKTAGA